jgi:MFS family permease
VRVLRFGATASLVVLFAINLANYMDRYLVVGLAPLIQKDFGISDTQVGLLMTSFVMVYMLASPFCGWLADRIPRNHVIASAVGLWSLATGLAAKAPSFAFLLGLRGTVGVGEAGYNAAGQALLTDIFPPEKRSRVMAVFNLAMPIGAALGFVLAGALGKATGWRTACLCVGLPGMLLALAAFMLPGGASESTGEKARVDDQAPPPPPPPVRGGTLTAYKQFLTDPVYMTNALGFAMQSFAIGGLSVWAQPFFVRIHGMEQNEAAYYTSGLVAGAGFVGTAVGALFADVFAKRALIPAYALVTAAGYFVAGPLLLAGLYIPDRNLALVCMFLGVVGMFLGTGPSNAIVSARSPALHRATGFALIIVLLHVLGDAPSPLIVGFVSDSFKAHGMPEGQALQKALVLAPVALLLASFCMLYCAFAAKTAKPIDPGDRAESAP